MTRAALLLVVTALGGAAQTVIQRTGQPPVVLINGWNLTCADSDTDSTGTFGRMEELLRAQGREVLFFNNCQQGNDSSSIESLGQKLRDLLNGLHYLDGSPALPVDVVTHSMGGLVLRSYLSGKQESGYAFNPPLATGIRKVVFIATPYWGASFFDIAPNLKAVEMLQVSQFLWDLSSWNQDADDLRGIDAIGILGTAGLLMAGDGTVTLLSGISLPTRIVPYCHSGSAKLICVPGARFMSQVDDEQHLSWRIVVYAVASLTVVRMLPVAIALIGTRLSRATVLFMGWFGPRGLASIVLGLVYLEQGLHLPGEATIRVAVMSTVVLSIFAHGFSAVPGISIYAREVAALDVSAPERNEPGRAAAAGR